MVVVFSKGVVGVAGITLANFFSSVDICPNLMVST
jgi:hypothetical protein